MKHHFYFFVILLVCLSCIVEGSEASQTSQPTVCLNMIVKNEADVIERCLASVVPIIDYWVIVDTGSADGTQEVIKNFMRSHGIPGELHERKWVNFSHNRNEALQLGKEKADYLLFADADEYFVYEDDFQLPCLDKDFYHVNIMHSGLKYSRKRLVNNHLDWKWFGVLHEYVTSPEASSSGTIEKVKTITTMQGARSRNPRKYEDDARILEEALKNEPNNDRYVFYLAQSYFDASNWEKALENYEKRVSMGGWDQEVYCSLLRIARIHALLEKSSEVVIDSYYKTFEYRPSRIEALYYLASFYRQKGDYESSYRIATIAESIPESNDILFIQQWMYDYGLQLEKSISAYWIGKHDECQEISLTLLEKDGLPGSVRNHVIRYLGLTYAKSIKKICDTSLGRGNASG